MSEDDIQRYEQMLADDPESRAFAPLAEAYRKANRLDDAIRTARAGLEVHPGYSGGLLVLGRALYETRELDPAAEVLQKAVADSPENYLGQKFLGKALKDKGDVQGALRALEAANFLSPEDEEVVRLLEELKKKATPPKKMEFEAGSGREQEEAQLVTYEQKPTTVDGIELDPLPVSEAFSFTPEGEDVTTDPAAIRPPVAQAAPQDVPPASQAVVSHPKAVEEEDVSVIEIPAEEYDDFEDDLEEVAGVVKIDDVDDIEAFDPEVAAFIEEGESLADTEMHMPEPEPQVEPAPVAEAPAVDTFNAPAAPAELPEIAPAPPSVPAPPAAGQPTDIPAAGVPVPQAQPEGIPAEPPVPAAAPTPEPALDLDLGLDALEEDMPDTMGFQPADPSSLDASATGGSISTETLADLYAQQGLTDKALEIYRQLLQERPGDEVVGLKIMALEGEMNQEAIQSPVAEPAVIQPLAVETAEPATTEPSITDPVPELAEPVVATEAAAAIPVTEPPPAPPVTPPVAPPEAASVVPPAVPQAGGTEEPGGSPGGSDVTETLGKWLKNAERMKNR